MKRIITQEFITGISQYLSDSSCPARDVNNIIKGLHNLPILCEPEAKVATDKPEQPVPEQPKPEQSTPPVDSAPVPV